MHIENIIHSNTTYKENIICWYRYVDDIFCIWDNSNKNLDKFEKHINSIHKNIKFTTETETNNKINYLNLTIHRTNNKLQFSIYRKESSKHILIPYRSNHPFKYKISNFNYMFNNLIKIPLTKSEYNKELNYILEIGIKFGYPKALLLKAYENIKTKNHPLYVPPPSSTESTTRYYPMTFINPPIARQISRILHPQGITPALKVNNTIGQSLTNNKQRHDPLEKSGVYSISCSECPAIYVGQTGRNLKTRFQEHMRLKTSMVYKHKNIKKHKISNKNLKLIHTSPKGSKLDMLEQLEIDKSIKDNSRIHLNVQKELHFHPLHRSLIWEDNG